MAGSVGESHCWWRYRGLGAWLLGPLWRSTYPLLLPQTIFVLGQGVGYGAVTGLHALGASRRSVRLAFLWAALYVICALVGGVTGGVTGTVEGAAVAPCACAPLWWWQLHAALRESGKKPAVLGFCQVARSVSTVRPLGTRYSLCSNTSDLTEIDEVMLHGFERSSRKDHIIVEDGDSQAAADYARANEGSCE